MSTPTEALGEIVEASTTQIRAQCRRLHEPPDFGSFVKMSPAQPAAEEADPFASIAAADGTVYALVYEARTGSLEPGRRPAAYGLDEAELRRTQPQVFELLVTEFAGLTIAYAEGGALHTVLPARPPRIHGHVEACSTAEVVRLTESLDFVPTILANPTCPAPDELIAASLRIGARVRPDPEAYMVWAMREVAGLLRNDYGRLDAVLRKVRL